MDRIREAITRAKTSEPVSEHKPPVRQRSKPYAAQSSNENVSYDRFAKISCNFADFGKRRIISNEQDPVLNAYRVLRTRVAQKLENSGWKSIAVVSPGPSAGKTVTAINLAIAMSSKAGVNPLLVDLDFYRPSVARYLGLEEFPSALDYFEEKKSLSDVIVQPDLPNLLLMPNERVTRRGAEHLSSDRVDNLIETATKEIGAGVVIFDMSPLLGCDDTIAFLPHVDCVLLVAASGQTKVHELKEAKRILNKTNIIGTVLNKSPSSLVSNPYY